MLGCPAPKVTIIILNWNGWKDTIECIDSIFKIDYPNYQLVIVDNASTNGSVEKIKQFLSFNYPLKSIIEITASKSDSVENPFFNFYNESLRQSLNEIILINNKNNDGFAIGNNIGIAFALQYQNPDFVLLLNNDTVVDKFFLTELMINVFADKKIGLASPLIYEYSNKNQIQYKCDKISWYFGRITPRNKDANNKICNTDTICGASMLIRAEVVRSVGFLPEEYFMLWEDVDYSVKAHRNGFSLVYVKTSKIWHKGSVSIGKVTSPMRIQYSIRNRFIFWKKYATLPQYLTFSIITLLIHIPIFVFFNILKTQDKTHYLNNLLSGLKDGITFSPKQVDTTLIRK